MATLIIHPATSYSPAESIPGNPGVCSTCGTEWDIDDHEGSYVKELDGEWFCLHTDDWKTASCFAIAEEAAYRKEVAEALTDSINGMLREIEQIDKRYRNTADDDQAHPTTMIDDLMMRVKLFGEGKDSGWRNDVMLDYSEAAAIRSTLEETVSIHSVDLSVRIDSLTREVGRYSYISPYAGYRDGMILAKAGRQLIALDALKTRTQEGAAA